MAKQIEFRQINEFGRRIIIEPRPGRLWAADNTARRWLSLHSARQNRGT
jgi:hypothetical protein